MRSENSIRDQTDWTLAGSSGWFTAGNGTDGVLRLASVQIVRQRLNSRTGALLATTALVAATTFAPDAAYAQTDWTGQFSSNWFLSGNWTASFPRQTTDGNIDTVTPNPTEVTSTGALAQNLSVGSNGTGMLTIQTGGTLADSFGTVGNLPRGRGTVMVTGLGSSWSNAGSVVVGGQGIGSLTIQEGGTVSSGGSSVGLTAGSTGTVTVTGPASSWTNGPSGGLNIGSFGTGTLTIASGGRVNNTTALNAANIGNSAGSLGLVTVTGIDSTWSNLLGVNIGNFGTGTFDCGRRSGYSAWAHCDRDKCRSDWNT